MVASPMSLCTPDPSLHDKHTSFSNMSGLHGTLTLF